MSTRHSPVYTRFTVSVPTALLEEAEQKVRQAGEGRSALLTRLLARALKEARDREDEEQWVRAYRDHPQTEEEFGWQDRPAREALAAQAWGEA